MSKKSVNIIVGQVLRSFRKREKMSQNRLGKVLKLHQAAVCRVERGQQHLSIEEWVRFCAFSKTPDTLTRLMKKAGAV